MARSEIRKHNRKIGEDITADIAKTISEDIADFVIELRDELEKATPKNSTHASINWLIRKQPNNQEYGERPDFPEFPEIEEHPQPNMDERALGITIAVDFDIMKDKRKNLVVFNNVPYVSQINAGTHPAQRKWVDKYREEHNPSTQLLGAIDFIEITRRKVADKHGF